MSDALRNYVSENPSNLGNFMSADNCSKSVLDLAVSSVLPVIVRRRRSVANVPVLYRNKGRLVVDLRTPQGSVMFDV